MCAGVTVLTSVCVCMDAPLTHLTLPTLKAQCEQHNSWSPDTKLTGFCFLTCAPDTPNTLNAHMHTLLVRALNGMNNRKDERELAWNTHLSVFANGKVC